MRNLKRIKKHQNPHRNSKDTEKVGCVVITPDQKLRKRLKLQKTVYSAELEAIIKGE
jgi:hypothetical protein